MITKSERNGRTLYTILNLPNSGQIANLPREAVVETMGVIGPGAAPAQPGAGVECGGQRPSRRPHPGGRRGRRVERHVPGPPQGDGDVLAVHEDVEQRFEGGQAGRVPA